MPRSHAPYPPEFCHQMVDLVRSGRSPTELARDFECCTETIRKCARQADLDEGPHKEIALRHRTQSWGCAITGPSECTVRGSAGGIGLACQSFRAQAHELLDVLRGEETDVQE